MSRRWLWLWLSLMGCQGTPPPVAPVTRATKMATKTATKPTPVRPRASLPEPAEVPAWVGEWQLDLDALGVDPEVKAMEGRARAAFMDKMLQSRARLRLTPSRRYEFKAGGRSETGEWRLVSEAAGVITLKAHGAKATEERAEIWTLRQPASDRLVVVRGGARPMPLKRAPDSSARWMERTAPGVAPFLVGKGRSLEEAGPLPAIQPALQAKAAARVAGVWTRDYEAVARDPALSALEPDKRRARLDVARLLFAATHFELTAEGAVELRFGRMKQVGRWVAVAVDEESVRLSTVIGFGDKRVREGLRFRLLAPNHLLLLGPDDLKVALIRKDIAPAPSPPRPTH